MASRLFGIRSKSYNFYAKLENLLLKLMGKKSHPVSTGRLSINMAADPVPTLRDMFTGLITFYTILEKLQCSIMGKKKAIP